MAVIENLDGWKWVGPALASAMEEYGLSVRDAAEAIGCSPATVSRIARGGTPDVENFILVNDWLKYKGAKDHLKEMAPELLMHLMAAIEALENVGVEGGGLPAAKDAIARATSSQV